VAFDRRFASLPRASRSVESITVATGCARASLPWSDSRDALRGARDRIVAIEQHVDSKRPPRILIRCGRHAPTHCWSKGPTISPGWFFAAPILFAPFAIEGRHASRTRGAFLFPPRTGMRRARRGRASGN